jgi:hypothetical protein
MFCKVSAVLVLLYGSELWVTGRKEESKFHATEIKFLVTMDRCTLYSHMRNKNVTQEIKIF